MLISGKEEPEAALSPAMDAVIRVFKRVSGLLENEAAGVAFCSIRLLVASTQAINLIGKQGSLIKSIQESTGATVRVLTGGMLKMFTLYFRARYISSHLLLFLVFFFSFHDMLCTFDKQH